jgi:pectinesterase
MLQRARAAFFAPAQAGAFLLEIGKMQRRECMQAGGLILGGLLFGCRMPPRETPAFEARVIRNTEYRSGVPIYPDIGSALRAAPSTGTSPYRVFVESGVWREKLVVEHPNVHLIGAGRGQTRLQFDAAAGHLAPDGSPWGTWGCATVIVRAPGFQARNLSIENNFDYIEHLRNPKLEQIGANGAQAVALMLDRGADRSLIERVDISSHQDSLFVDAGRSLFRDCTVSGSVDFIFGAGCSVFDRCNLHSRYRPGKDRQGYVSASSTRSDQQFGLSFLDCSLTRDAGIPDGSVALGRAWRPTRPFADGSYGDPDVLGAAAYLRCTMDAHIGEAAWDEMAYTARDGSRVMLKPLDARLFEYQNHGPGALINAQRRQLSEAEAGQYTIDRILGDWSDRA